VPSRECRWNAVINRQPWLQQTNTRNSKLLLTLLINP
jgi:hypothetical protein